MKIEKIFLDEIYRCYSTMAMKLDDQLHFFFASEEKGYPAYAYSGADFKSRKTVWENGGGVMSMIPLPDVENQFLVIKDFYLKESPSKAKLVWVTYSKETGFVEKDLFYLPYLHRFDLFKVEDKVFFIGGTIAHTKKDKEDWSNPGKIYVAQLPSDLSQPIELDVLVENLTRNHGYYRANDNSCGYFSSDEGVLKITPPKTLNADWVVEKILEGRVSEIAFVDVDHDGVEEMITIEPFHGNEIYIYKVNNGKYKRVYKYPFEIDFAHTLVGAKILGTNTFVGGVRRMNSDLFMIQFINGEYVTTIVDEKVGPANLAVANLEGYDVIHSSNHTHNHAAVYIIKE